MVARTIVIGAGLAGLACAVRLAGAGRRVDILEAAGHAGGRCRSYFDEILGCQIDNGNHLLLSGNRATFDYLAAIGASETVTGPPRAEYRFFDLDARAGWTLRPNGGRLPWWVFAAGRRVPGTRAVDYLRGYRLAGAGLSQTVADVLDDGGALYRRFWEPFALAVLNTDPREASAALLWPVVRETLGRGESAYRPRMARRGLSESFVDPAVAFLERHAAAIRFGHRVRRIRRGEGRISGIELADAAIDLGPQDAVVLAVPAPVCGDLLPEIVVPDAFRAILNAHFRLEDGSSGEEMVGLVGGTAQWMFRRGDVVSVTISAADAIDMAAEAVAIRLWAEIATVLGCQGRPLPRFRIIREKRATFAQTSAQVRRRPATTTPWQNLVLAGDWTDTGIPATIEGAVRSGHKAAESVMSLSKGS